MNCSNKIEIEEITQDGCDKDPWIKTAWQPTEDELKKILRENLIPDSIRCPNAKSVGNRAVPSETW